MEFEMEVGVSISGKDVVEEKIEGEEEKEKESDLKVEEEKVKEVEKERINDGEEIVEKGKKEMKFVFMEVCEVFVSEVFVEGEF